MNADVPGVIMSPNYPRSYPHNTRCVWLLRGTPGRKVTLTFTNFGLEAHSSCNYDYLELRQGDNANASLINRYCGTTLPPTVTSFGNSLFVKLVTDASTSGIGFRAEYTTATSGIIFFVSFVSTAKQYKTKYRDSKPCYSMIIRLVATEVFVSSLIFETGMKSDGSMINRRMIRRATCI